MNQNANDTCMIHKLNCESKWISLRSHPLPCIVYKRRQLFTDTPQIGIDFDEMEEVAQQQVQQQFDDHGQPANAIGTRFSQASINGE